MTAAPSFLFFVSFVPSWSNLFLSRGGSMSWIFHEPLEGAIYARRAIAPPPAVAAGGRSFSPAARFHGVDLFTGDAWPAQRRAYAPSAARRSFRRPSAAYGLYAF